MEAKEPTIHEWLGFFFPEKKIVLVPYPNEIARIPIVGDMVITKTDITQPENKAIDIPLNKTAFFLSNRMYRAWLHYQKILLLRLGISEKENLVVASDRFEIIYSAD